MLKHEISEKDRAAIEGMSHEDMAYMYRFAPSWHPYFQCDTPEWELFIGRFKELGGMTSEISRKIGW
jgi:hypothetical protein